MHESLKLKNDNSNEEHHYRDRRDLRIKNLNVNKVVRNGKLDNNISGDELSDIENFFRKVLYAVSDPDSGKLFDTVDVSHDKYGLIMLGKSSVILKDGSKVYPIFSVSDGKGNTSSGLNFWIQTDGSNALTILVLDQDGETSTSKERLIGRALNHIKSNRLDGLNRKLRHHRVGIDPAQLFKIINNPISVKEITLNLKSGESVDDQADKLVSEVLNPKLEPVVRELPNVELESIPGQMNLTPGRIWIMEFNAKFNASNDCDWLNEIEHARVICIDILEFPQLRKKYNINVVPTVIILEGGKEIERYLPNIMMEVNSTKEDVQSDVDGVLINKF